MTLKVGDVVAVGAPCGATCPCGEHRCQVVGEHRERDVHGYVHSPLVAFAWTEEACSPWTPEIVGSWTNFRPAYEEMTGLAWPPSSPSSPSLVPLGSVPAGRRMQWGCGCTVARRADESIDLSSGKPCMTGHEYSDACAGKWCPSWTKATPSTLVRLVDETEGRSIRGQDPDAAASTRATLVELAEGESFTFVNDPRRRACVAEPYLDESTRPYLYDGRRFVAPADLPVERLPPAASPSPSVVPAREPDRVEAPAIISKPEWLVRELGPGIAARSQDCRHGYRSCNRCGTAPTIEAPRPAAACVEVARWTATRPGVAP